MALINCPECNNKVSDAVPTCPKCSTPIAGAKEGKTAGVQLTIFQEAGKRLKIQKVFSLLLLFIGLFWSFRVVASIILQDGKISSIPFILVFLSLVWLIIISIRLSLADTREHKRKKVSIEAEYTCGDDRFKDSIENISNSGVFIKTDEIFSVGQEITLSFSIPKSLSGPKLKLNDKLNIDGEIVRIEPDGVGIRLAKLIPLK
jgi:Tfp pilus assembly protein PilZ/uncharacterized membrane protein YuzA (DUF378 family)